MKLKRWLVYVLILAVVSVSGCGKDNPASSEADNEELRAKAEKMELIGKMLGSAVKKDAETLADYSDGSSISLALAAVSTADENESGIIQTPDGWTIYPLRTDPDGSTFQMATRTGIDPATGKMNMDFKVDETKPLSEGKHQEKSTLIKMFNLGQPDFFAEVEGDIANVTDENNRYSLSYTLHIKTDENGLIPQGIAFATSDNWTGALTFVNGFATGPVKDETGEKVATLYFNFDSSLNGNGYFILTDDPNQEKHQIEIW